MRYGGIVATAVGTAKLHDHFAKLQFTRASAVTCAFCYRIQEVQFSFSRRGPPRSGTYFLRPLSSRFMEVLRWLDRTDDLVDLVHNFCFGVYFFDGLARISTRLPMFYAIYPHLCNHLRLRCPRILPTSLFGHVSHSHFQGHWQGHPGNCSPSKELLPWLELTETRRR